MPAPRTSQAKGECAMIKRFAVSAAIVLATLTLAACQGEPGKKYDYSRAGFTPDHGNR